jgi:hypothetical protein
MTTIAIEFDDAKAAALRAEAARRNMTVEELLRKLADKALPQTLPAGSEKLHADLERIWASLPPGLKPPTDEEIEQLKHERRMRKVLP